MTGFRNKEIVLGITGCIAAYKSAELVRQIIKQDGQVHVVMTESAREFISPLTLQTLSVNPVVMELFSLYEEKEIGHISLAERADLLVVAPATANTIGKIAGGIADDMLSTVISATRAPVLIAPAMNVNMWENPIVQRNITTLKDLGYHFIEPATGDLACGTQGKGRLAEIDDIVDEMITVLSPRDFSGKNVLVTAGPTREPLDPVRFMTNPSSGKMGFAIARAFCRRGGAVTLISGPVSIAPPRNVRFVPVLSARDMADAVDRYFEPSDIIVKTAAVADYRPRSVSDQKIKKQDDSPNLELERTTDILATLGKKKGNRILVGFAAETQDLIVHAQEKLERKNLDMIVANDVGGSETGFAVDVNKVSIITAGGPVDELPVMSKEEVAEHLLDRIARLLETRQLSC